VRTDRSLVLIHLPQATSEQLDLLQPPAGLGDLRAGGDELDK
jgi:hypothetical protein